MASPLMAGLVDLPLVQVLAGCTGRGDTCLAAYRARRLSAPPQEACRYAAAVTSLKMERPGPLAAGAQEIERLFEELAERSR